MSINILAEYSSSPSVTLHAGYRTVTTSSFARSSSMETVEIPEELNSQEAVGFCGLEEVMPRQLFAH